MNALRTPHLIAVVIILLKQPRNLLPLKTEPRRIHCFVINFYLPLINLSDLSLPTPSTHNYPHFTPHLYSPLLQSLTFIQGKCHHMGVNLPLPWQLSKDR